MKKGLPDDHTKILIDRQVTGIADLADILMNATDDDWLEGLGQPNSIQDEINWRTMGKFLANLPMGGSTMRKRDELASPNSCLNKAKDDEMIFVVLGRDLAAPAAIREWIDERIRLGKNKPGDAQIIEAEQWIETVLAEQRALFGQRNERRIELAEKKNREGLSADEKSEFNELQQWCFEYLSARHPGIQLEQSKLDEIVARLGLKE